MKRMREDASIIELAPWSKTAALSVSVMVVIFNSIEIHVLRRTVNKPLYEKILLSLTICDLTWGIFAILNGSTISILENKYHILIAWNVWRFLTCYLTTTSLLHLICISVDRLWAVGAPLHHRRNVAKKKLVITIVSSWSIPILFVIINIIIILLKELDAEGIYWYTEGAMYSLLAKVILVSDMMLLFSNSAIIWIVNKRRTVTRQSSYCNQTKLKSTLILCMGIVFVFIFFTTPFVVMHLVSWSKPQWIVKLSSFLFPLYQISNSLIYLLQKFRHKRRGSTTRSNSQISVNTQDTRL